MVNPSKSLYKIPAKNFIIVCTSSFGHFLLFLQNIMPINFLLLKILHCLPGEFREFFDIIINGPATCRGVGAVFFFTTEEAEDSNVK